MHICNNASSVFIRSRGSQEENIVSFSFRCHEGTTVNPPPHPHPPRDTTQTFCERSDSNCCPAQVARREKYRTFVQKNQPFKLYKVCFLNSLTSVCASMLQFCRDWLCRRNGVQRAGGELASVGAVRGVWRGGSSPLPASTWRSWSWIVIGWRRWWRR